MSLPLRRVSRGLILSGLGVLGSAAAAGTALWRALAPAVPLAAPPAPAVVTRAGRTVPPAYAAERVLAAVEKDPFQAERRRPTLAFRLPQEPRGSPRRPAAPGPVSGIRVIGTAVLPGGGFAICQRSGGSPTLVRLGDVLGELTLKAVEPGAATFVTAAGATLVVRVLKPGGGS